VRVVTSGGRATRLSRRMLVVVAGAVAALLALAAPAAAATSTVVISGAGQGAPASGVWLSGTAIDPATGGPVQHYWTSDHLLGLCRLDSTPVVALTHCVGVPTVKNTHLTVGPGPTLATRYVYTGDIGGGGAGTPGVKRFLYDPTQDLGQGLISSVSQLLSGATCNSLPGNLPQAVAMGPDNNLYVGLRKNNGLWRITNAAGALGTQVCTQIGQDFKQTAGLAFDGTNLWIVDQKSIALITDAAGACPGCGPGLVASSVQLYSGKGVSADPVNHVLYLDGVGSIDQLTGVDTIFFVTLSTYAPGRPCPTGVSVNTIGLVAGTVPVVMAGEDTSIGCAGLANAGQLTRITTP